MTIEFRDTKKHANADFCSRFAVRKPDDELDLDESDSSDVVSVVSVMAGKTPGKTLKHPRWNKTIYEIRNNNPHRYYKGGEGLSR